MKPQVGNVATGAIGLTVIKVKAGGREGLADGKAPIPFHGLNLLRSSSEVVLLPCRTKFRN